MEKQLKSEVELTDIDLEVSVAYDYEFKGTTTSSIKLIDKNSLPKDYRIGLIIGQSGSGKSTNLKEFGENISVEWDDSKSLASNFESYEEAKSKLHGCGLNSIKVWTQPRHTLSTGQAYRADIAKTIESGRTYDEFCSYLDENTSKSLSHSLNKYIHENDLSGVVFATCREDVVEWLRPDWVFNCNTGELILRGLERRRPSITLEISPCTVQVWELFKDHHYLSGSINKGARCWVATWNGQPVGFYATLAQPSGTMKDAWRGSRLVVLPEFQGMGLSSVIYETVAQIHLDAGKRFFAKTASELLGSHRENSSKWKPTSKNKKKRWDYNNGKKGKYSEEHLKRHAHRVCYSHEFIGE